LVIDIKLTRIRNELTPESIVALAKKKKAVGPRSSETGEDGRYLSKLTSKPENE